MTTVGATTGAGTGCGGIEYIEQVDTVVVQRRQQGFEIFVQGSEFGGIDRLIGIELRCHDHLLTAFDQYRINSVGEVELGASVIGGDQYFTFLKGISHAQFAQIALGVARPGLAGNRDNCGDGHDMAPCVVCVFFNYLFEGYSRYFYS
ncbi:hypothetical protein OCT51_12400 [Halomonas sp. LR3S48]|nr:hypothetical protein [Halomonas sp. LR3S48]UYG02003.1 hypothetical protein OCT51_12400 [Halomonas sp. LR3S48]